MKDRKRISFLLSSLRLFGGVRVIVEIANRLHDRGHTVFLISPGNSIDVEVAKVIDPGVSVITTRRAGEAGMSLLAQGLLTWQLAAAVPKSDFIFTTHTPTTPAGWIASSIFRRGKLLWFYQDFPEMFTGRHLMAWLNRNALRWHSGAFVVSEFIQNELNRYVPKKPVFVIGEAISRYDSFQPYGSEQRLAQTGGADVIFYLGDTRPRKGLMDLLRAVEIVQKSRPHIELWLALKDGGQVETNLPVRYFPRPTDEELARFYASCSVFVFASWQEGFGLPPLEAMACAAPVVLTDSGGVREYARPGENCLMVPPQNPSAFAQAILQILENPTLALSLRSNGPATAASFTWDAVIDRFEDALTRVV